MRQLEPEVAKKPGNHLVDFQQGEVAADAEMAATAKLERIGR
jgi:hypothetical protein